MERWTFKQLAQHVLKEVKQPLTPDEIWDVAKKLNCTENVASVGKTPARSISAQLYTETADNEESIFIRVGQRPTKFFLRNIKPSKGSEKDSPALPENQIKYKEKDLHKILSSFVSSNPHFMAKTKTINHLRSSRKQAGRTEWLHPDIVGIHFAFKDYSKQTLNLQKLLSTSSYKLFSFELKIKLDMTHLREYYFQAVSNSSWAHEGYLVVNELDFNDDLMDELRRLNNAFGIGLIELNAENFEQSKIVFFARHNDELNWLTIDQLAKLNKDFLEFLDDIDKDYKTTSIRGSYDEIYKDASIARDDLRSKGVL